MTEATTIVPCAQCGASNRVPTARLASAPRCGKCGVPLFAGAPLAVTATAFDRLASRGDLPVLADFWAAWCGPCQAMAPAFAAAAPILEPEMRLMQVDTEAEQGLAARYAIRSIPTLMLLKGGREIARTAGAMSQQAIVAWARQAAAAI